MNWLKILVQKIFLNGFQREQRSEIYSLVSNVENTYLITEDNQKIGAYLIKPQMINQSTNYFIFCHGKGSDRRKATRLAKLDRYAQLNNAMFLVIDYRGFGDSTGDFVVDHINKDLDAAFTYLRDNFKATSINLIGHSMGCTVAFEYCKYLKSRNINQPERLFLFSGFISLMPLLREFKIYRILERLFPFIHYLLPGDLQLDSTESIEMFDGSLYLFHGKKDPLVPVYHATTIKEIFEKTVSSRNEIKKKRCILRISEDSHDHILSNPEHWDLIFKEIKRQ